MAPWSVWIVLGSVFGSLGVALGALGAHLLKSRLSEHYLGIFETAVRYQMYHAMVLILTGLVALRIEGGWITAAGVLFVGGTLLFSGSLYTLCFSEQKWWGAVTPLGGVMLIAGWLCLAYGVWQKNLLH